MTTEQQAFDKKRKFLLVLPLIAAPFLFLAFYALGGGQGDPGKAATDKAAGMGFNTELPPPVFSKKDTILDKMTIYEQAKKDSLRRREAIRQDPYRSGGNGSAVGGNWLKGTFNPMNAQVGAGTQLNTRLQPEDTEAEELQQKLEQIKRSLGQGGRGMPARGVQGRMGNNDVPGNGVVKPPVHEPPPVTAFPKPDTPRRDPELDRLGAMLDKIAAIQHGEQKEEPLVHSVTTPIHDAPSATIPAVVQGEQGLVSGATITLRLTEEVLIGGVRIPRDQLVYGQATINNDRMMVHIGSIRGGQSIYLTSLQLYDMDGLPGIHIPDMLGRQVVRQSADQGIGSLNLAGYDPSIGAQATNAGIQAAKSLFSRKIRLVKVSVRNGYRVLLKDTKGTTIVVMRDTVSMDRIDPGCDSCGGAPAKVEAPEEDSLQPFMHHATHEGRIRLTLQGIYLRDGLMWLSFEWVNRSKIDYVPDYLHCSIREGRRLKRTAMQEIPLKPLYQRVPPLVAGDSTGRMLLGFRPFTLEKGKKLLVQVGERDGGRGLEMEISPKLLLNAK